MVNFVSVSEACGGHPQRRGLLHIRQIRQRVRHYPSRYGGGRDQRHADPQVHRIANGRRRQGHCPRARRGDGQDLDPALDTEYRDGVWQPESRSDEAGIVDSCRRTPSPRPCNSIETTTVILSGNTGWDFTVEGSDISKVTLLDATGVTGTGAVGGVTAFATGTAAVTFKGGDGYDTFGGAAGVGYLRRR